MTAAVLPSVSTEVCTCRAVVGGGQTAAARGVMQDAAEQHGLGTIGVRRAVAVDREQVALLASRTGDDGGQAVHTRWRSDVVWLAGAAPDGGHAA
jgi:hypothetical protein